MVAIFETECCHREIVFGRFKGGEMNPPSVAQCHFGCQPRPFPSGKPGRISLTFLRYQSEETLAPELRATEPLLDKQGGNHWHRYNAAWLKARSQA